MDRIVPMFQYLVDNVWLQRILLLVGGIAVGLGVEFLLVRRLRRAAKRTGWAWDDVILEALRGMPILWFTLWGGWSALELGTFSADGDGVNWWARGQRVLEIVFLASLVLVAMRMTGGAIRSASARSDGALPSPTLVTNLGQILVAALGAIIILQNQGIEITPIITALGIGGLAVALALQDTLGNLFAGVQIILSRQVRPADYIRLESGEQGYVTDVKGRNTTIRTIPDGNLVIVPNSKLASAVVKNFSLPTRSLWVSIPVGVSYSSDLEHVETVTLDVARKVMEQADMTSPGHDPILLFEGFGESSIDFQLRIHCRDFTEQFAIRHTFIKRLHARYNEEGIVIPFPIRTLDIPDEATLWLRRRDRGEGEPGDGTAPMEAG